MLMSSVFIKTERLECPICLQVLLSPWEALLEQLPRRGVRVTGRWLPPSGNKHIYLSQQ